MHRIRPFAIALALLVSAGCAGTPGASPDVERDLNAAVAADGLIRFKTEAAPLDDPAPSPDLLTLPDAVRRTLINDPRIQSALARTRAAAADAHQARLLPNPILDVVFRFPEGGGDPVVEAGLAADLLSLLQRPRRVGAADHRLRAAAADALAITLDVLADVQERYAAVQALDARAAVLDERRALLDRLLELARARFNAGEGSRLEVTSFEAERLKLEAELAERHAERTEARLILSRLIGHPSGAAAWRLDPWSPPSWRAAPEQAWVAAALANRPEVSAGRWKLAALGDDAALARFALWDGASIGAAAEREADAWTVGPALSAPLPVFDWGQARRGRAKAEVIEARHEMTALRRAAVTDARIAYATLVASRAAVERATTQLLPLQQRRREQAEAAYRIGEADLPAVLLAEQDLREAAETVVTLQQRATSALIRLHRVAGGPAAAEKADAGGGDAPPATEGSK